MPEPFLRSGPEGVLLAIKLQPRASRNAIESPAGSELKIRVTAPPVDSAANEALIELLAERLECAKNALRLVRGHASRHKVVLVRGLELNEVATKLSRPFA